MPAPFLRASCFWLLTGTADCWKCSQSTQVSAIALAGYDELVDDAEWEWVDGRSLLSYISGVDPVSLRAIQDVAPWLRYGRSATVDTTYLSNHCLHCGALQGDWFLADAGSVFFPTDQSEMQDFAVYRFDLPLAIDAQPSFSGWHDWLPLADASFKKPSRGTETR